MANKLDPKVVAFSLASVSAVLSVACAILLAAAPEASLKFFGSIFHGVDMAKVAAPVTASGVATGIVAAVVVALVAGWLFAAAYNYFLKRK